MTNKTYIVLGIILGIAIGFVGYGLIHKDTIRYANIGQASNAAGSSYSSAKIAAQDLVVSSSTVFSQLNGDATDRIINSTKLFAIGGTATTSQYNLQCATSSTQYQPALGTNINLVYNQALQTLGTTTGSTGLYNASTSPGITGIPFGSASTTARIWSAGSYLVCSTTDSVANTNSLNTLDANTTGFIGIDYNAQ